jgi:competence ComEA-like helix-hairpin-helix protein
MSERKEIGPDTAERAELEGDEIEALEQLLERGRAEARAPLEELERSLAEAGNGDEAEAARRAAAEGFERELESREQELQRERDAVAAAAEEAERRLAGVAEQVEAASASVDSAERALEDERARLREEGESLRRELASERESQAAEARKAEQRAAEAEQRATDAERRAAQAEQRAELAEQAVLEAEAAARSAAAEWLRGRVRSIEREAAKAAVRGIKDQHRADQETGAPAPSEEAESAPAEPAPPEPAETTERSPVPAPTATQVNVNEASFEQLRQIGMSVTQATRLIAYRERRGGFESIDELDSVPGFKRSSLIEIKQRLTV